MKQQTLYVQLLPIFDLLALADLSLAVTDGLITYILIIGTFNGRNLLTWRTYQAINVRGEMM